MRCTPVTEDDRRNLVDYLSPLDDSIGSTITALEDLSLKGQLLFANDRWTFRSPGRPKTTTRKTVIRDYYRDIFSQLNHQERELLEWTCCHRGPVAFDVLLEVSPFNESDIDSCLDNLKTYRLLDQAPRDGIRCLEISSKNIHNTIYNLIATKRKIDIHDLYSRYYEKRSTTEPENGLDTATSTSLQLVHQYRGARNYRPLLLTQIRLARALETNSQLIALRTICEEGISALSTINSDRWQQQVLAVIRFLVVKLVDACWILNDFDTLRHAVSAQYKTSPHRIPIRTFLKYSLSLVYSSNYDSVLTTARAIRHAYPLQNSQAHVTADLVDAIVMLENAKLSNASALLQRVESFSSKLDDYGRCRLLTSYVILYDKLDNERASRKYIPLLERYSKQMGFIHEHLIGATARFNLSFKKSQLSECKAIIKRSVRLAMKHRMYYRLADWHFLASAVYYEEGSYAKSIHHVEQCLQMFERLGQAFKLPEMLTRISMNYYHAGLYGNSVRYIERAIRLWNPQWNAAEGAVIFLFALEIHIAINSKHVARYNKISKQYLDRHPEVSRWGYYWHLSGLHNHQLGNNALALKDFERSRIDEERKGAIDDAVRSGMKEAFALIDLGKMDKVGNLVLYLRKLSRSLESKNIEAELKVLELSYHYFKRSPRSVIKRHIKAVEDVRDQAKEVPVLLIIDKILFRVKARHGEVDSSKAAFRRYLKTLKSISDNIQDRDDALAFLGRDDEKLALQEYKLICNK
jgi:tetratricopeptide (TPR) repeat protein